MNEQTEKEPEQEADPSAAAMATVGGQEEAESGWTGDSGGGELATATEEDGPVNIDLILDLPLQIVVELGRTKMLINDLLQIGQGSVIELNKQVGEPLDVLVNGKLVARGEVVVVKDKFGIRITDVISPLERIKQLA